MPYEITQEDVAGKKEGERKIGLDDFLKPGSVGISKKGQVAETNISKELLET